MPHWTEHFVSRRYDKEALRSDEQWRFPGVQVYLELRRVGEEYKEEGGGALFGSCTNH